MWFPLFLVLSSPLHATELGLTAGLEHRANHPWLHATGPRVGLELEPRPLLAFSASLGGYPYMGASSWTRLTAELDAFHVNPTPAILRWRASGVVRCYPVRNAVGVAQARVGGHAGATAARLWDDVQELHRIQDATPLTAPGLVLGLATDLRWERLGLRLRWDRERLFSEQLDAAVQHWLAADLTAWL
jgi:hypothetical protein